ncbi:hypothetical protein KW800_00970 [Candidatus Parcubacteria bacterium]|nr:hypothetical protein [Candidatus Parcubacteria bacterium]
MSRRALFISIPLVLIAGTAVLYFLLGGKSPVVSTIINSLPFGTSPDGSSNPVTNDGSNDDDGTQTGLGADGKPLAKLFKLSDAPVAGSVSFAKNGLTFVRYVDRATGHVLEINLATLEKQQIANTTIPKVYEALWKGDASGFVARSLDEGHDVVKNASITLIAPKSTSTSNLYTETATLLRGSVDELAVMPNGNLLYVLDDTGALALSSFLGEKPKTLFTMPFTNWRLVPVNASTALIYTKASEQALGYAYTLNLSTGAMTKVLGPLLGLTANLSPDGKRALFAYESDGSNTFSILNLSSKASTTLFPNTLPEKCAWSVKSSSTVYCGAPSGGFPSGQPDLWYKGLTSFADRVWRIDVTTNSTDVLADPSTDFHTDIDVEKPFLSPSEDYLFFINKSDLSLWALKLIP